MQARLLTVEHPTYRQFLLGSAYLNQGEEEKAVDLFLSAAGGVPQDTFLTEDLLNLSDTASGECMRQGSSGFRGWGEIPQDSCLTGDILNPS